MGLDLRKFLSDRTAHLFLSIITTTTDFISFPSPIWNSIKQKWTTCPRNINTNTKTKHGSCVESCKNIRFSQPIKSLSQASHLPFCIKCCSYFLSLPVSFIQIIFGNCKFWRIEKQNNCLILTNDRT